MNKLLYLFSFLFISIGVSSQCLDNITDSETTVYEESPLSGGILTFEFDDQLSLVKIPNSTTYYICSDRLVVPNIMDIEYYGGPKIDIQTTASPKDIMCYYHLNNAWNKAVSSAYINVPAAMPTKIEFNPDYSIGSASDDKPQIQITKNPGGSYLPMIEYSISNDDQYDPLALDAFAIVSGFYQFLHEVSMGNTNTRAKDEGVDHGISNYFAGRYISELTQNDEVTGYTYGGTDKNGQEVIPSELWQSINFSLEKLYMKHGNLSAYYDGGQFEEKDEQPQSELLSAALWQLGKGLGFSKIDKLLSDNYAKFNSNVSTQSQFGVILYNTAAAEGSGFSEDDKCYIYKVFGFVYGGVFLGDANLSPVDYIGEKDYIIRDSYEGQPNWEWGDQFEDIGDEPNEITTAFSSSPDIWNKLQPSLDDKEHETPEYNNGATNYLYVDVRLESCEAPSSSDMLHVYIRESHLAASWPLDWTAGYYDSNDTDSPLIGYEITNSDNNELLAANTLGIQMTEYVSFQVEQYTIPNTGEEIFYKVYRYEIPWVPINPLELDDYSEVGAEAWACLLARVVSADDDMFDEQESDYTADPQIIVTAWDNNVENNNIAIRNTSILHVDGLPGVSGDVITGLNVTSPYATTGGPGTTIGTPNPDLDIEIAIHQNDDYTDDGDPIIPSTTGPGDPVIFNYIDLEIILSDEFLAEWTSSGLQGSGFTWINANTIKVTSATFNIKAIKLPPRKNHRIFVKTSSTQDFTSINFTFLLKDFNSKTIGSQTYNTRGSLWTDRSGKRSDGSRSDAKSTIEVHPNPAQDYVTVSSNTLEISKIEVYSVSNERMNVSYQAVDTKTTRVNISELSAGIYFMRVQNAENIETIKFVKL